MASQWRVVACVKTMVWPDNLGETDLQRVGADELGHLLSCGITLESSLCESHVLAR